MAKLSHFQPTVDESNRAIQWNKPFIDFENRQDPRQEAESALPIGLQFPPSALPRFQISARFPRAPVRWLSYYSSGGLDAPGMNLLGLDWPVTYRSGTSLRRDHGQIFVGDAHDSAKYSVRAVAMVGRGTSTGGTGEPH